MKTKHPEFLMLARRPACSTALRHSLGPRRS
jgi:hypothetical protein